MGRRSDSSLAAGLLTQRLVETSAAPLKASEYWALLDRAPDPGTLLGLGAEQIVATADVDRDLAERIAGLFDCATAFAFALDELEQSGVCLLASVDEEYPRALLALGDGAPPLLHVAGDVGLLGPSLLGVVGSRDVSEDGAEVARSAARVAARHGIGTVSGGAKGVDRLAMQGALEADASAVGVLAESLVRTARDAEVRRAITDGQLCLCSPYKPTAPFSVAGAMGRNKIIYALSAATLVVASDLERGGTWGGATEALRRGIAPVLVWTGPGAGRGNERLVELGATAIDAIDRLFPLPHRAASEDQASSEQLALEV